MNAATALFECLGGGVRGPRATGRWMRDWVAAGFRPPSRAPRPEGPPDPRGADPARWRLDRQAGPGEVRRAARWAAGARFDGRQRAAALDFLTDALAVGAARPPPGIVPEAAAAAILGAPASSDAARLWRPVGHRRAAGLAPAVLWNRLPGDALELHAGPEIAAAAVAAAERGGRTLGELLDALAAGAGISAWHRDLVGAALEDAGVHSPGALAAVSTAAAVSRLLGCGPRRMAAAMLRADRRMPIHPYRAFAEGATVKLAYGAWGQAVGLRAALEIAAVGLRALPDTAAGSPPVRSGGEGRGFDEAKAAAAITALAFKRRPGSRALAPTFAALSAMPRFDPDRIASVEVETYPFSALLSSWADPDGGPIARQMHLPAAVALFLRTRFRGEPFRADAYRAWDPGVRSLARRVRVEARDFGNPEAPPGSRIRRARVRVTTRDGLVREAEANAGYAPPPPGALRTRFRELAGGSALKEPWTLAPDAPARDLFRAGEPGRSGR